MVLIRTTDKESSRNFLLYSNVLCNECVCFYERFFANGVVEREYVFTTTTFVELTSDYGYHH